MYGPAQKYRKLCTAKTEVECVLCKKAINICNMRKHFEQDHVEVNTKLVCIWCVDYTWTGVVSDLVNYHRLDCALARREMTQITPKKSSSRRKRAPKKPTTSNTNLASSSKSTTSVTTTTDDLQPSNNTVAVPVHSKSKLSPFDSYIATSKEESNVPQKYTNLMGNSKVVNDWIMYYRMRDVEDMGKHTRRVDMDQSLYTAFNNERPDWLINDYDVVERDLLKFHNTFVLDELTNVDMFWVKAFCYKRQLAWFSFTVNFSSWSAFETIYKLNRKNMCILPYSCLCTGGPSHHRHLIMVMPRNSIPNVMNNKRWVSTVPSKQIRYLRRSNVMNIINAIQSVSTYGSCDFFSKVTSSTTANDEHSNYCIFNPTIPYADLWMSLVSPKGLQCYMQQKYINKNICGLPTLRCDNIGWAIKSIHVVDERFLVMPLSKDVQLQKLDIHPATVLKNIKCLFDDMLIANACMTQKAIVQKKNLFYSSLPNTDEIPRGFIFIGPDWYCIQNNEDLISLSLAEWNRHQIDTGNCFLDIHGDNLFRPNDFYQKMLSAVKAATINKTTADNLYRQISQLNDLIVQNNEIIMAKNDEIAQKNTLLEEKMRQLKRCHEELNEKEILITNMQHHL